MSEEETPVVEETAPADTPVEGTGTAQQQQEQENWQERYQNLQPEYTRATQEAAQLRQWQERLQTDDEALRTFLAERGIELQADTPEPGLADDPYAEKIAAMEQRLVAQEEAHQAQQQAQQLAQAEQHFNQQFTSISTDRGTPLDEEEQNAIIGLALTMAPGDDGMPPVKAAYDALEKVWEKRAVEWAKKKPKPTHRVSANGAAGEAVPDRATHDGRVAAMLEQLQD